MGAALRNWSLEIRQKLSLAEFLHSFPPSLSVHVANK